MSSPYRLRISLLSAEEERQVEAGELKEIEGDTVYYVEVKPFDQLTTADHIRLFESNEKDTGISPEEVAKNRLVRVGGIPSRAVRAMSHQNVADTLALIEQLQRDHDKTLSALAKVHETLEHWAKEHDKQDWTIEDAKAVIEDHGLFCDRITVNQRTYTAPLVEPSAYGKWIDLSNLMAIEGAKESESYIRALSIMMEGEDGPYPVQGKDEGDKAYADRCNAYTAQRRKDFSEARYVEVLGCAAFFFSKWERFAVTCGHSMKLLQSLMRPGQKPTPRVIPAGGVPGLS